jgi:glycosyltransferase involved in cell wall biosynthesis
MSDARQPRTALVHDWLTGMRGGEKVLESIADLFPEAPIYALFHFPGTVSSALEKHPIHTSFLQSYPGASTHYRRYLPLFPAAIEDFDFNGYDLLISTSHCVAKGARPAPGTFHICYCHTPMRYAWDQEQTYFPQRTGLVARLRNLALTRLRSWDVTTAGRVDLFLANSRFVAERIQRYYGREAEVVPPPVDTDFFVPSEDPPGQYAIVVSALAPYKRIEVAIVACERLGLELRIVGTGPEQERLSRLAGPTTKLLGYLPSERLRKQLQGALCFLQPGVEDFGISSVEALASGCPVVALERGGIRDIVRNGEHGVLYQGEGDPEALATAIDKCREISFNKLNLKGRADEFSGASFEARFRSTLETRLSGWDLP